MVLFEFLALESFQAGLSWFTILRKREAFHRAFRSFDVEKVTHYTERDIGRLLADSGIVRNRRKIEAVISNARRVLEIRQQHGSLNRYIWQFAGHATIRRPNIATAGIPTSTP
jgi:DNA-3-methyladenine glycosylase I